MAQPTRPAVSRTRRVLRWFLIVVLVVLLAAGAGVGWWLYQNRADPIPAGTPAQPALTSVDPSIVAVRKDAPAPTAAGVAKALAAPLKDPALGKLTGQVTDPLTGKVLWSRGADQPRVPASNAKILTASAVLLALPHNDRLTTKVVLEPSGRAILVGAGDPTLTSIPDGERSFYSDPARIDDLVDQIKKSGKTVTSVAVDTSLFTGPTMAKSWDRGDIEGGDIAPIESLMVDGGRLKPAEEYSPRTTEPALDAGRALASELGVNSEVENAPAPSGAPTIAQVSSAPLTVRVGDMMRFSDNVLAESLAIELARATGGEASIAGGAEAVLTTLRKNGFDADAATLVDSSGISYSDRVPASLLDALMTAAADDGHPKLRSLLDSLPVAAGTGTLADRFDPDRTPGAGWVRGKTGTLTGVSSLTGVVQTVDGRVLAFAMISGGTSPEDARPAVDAVVGALRDCGCRD
ncbi:D-alanyl-D-alanine carboxypeptidase/D-alanyl-D-alanine endopeptidase [Gordonia hydrophobica]|uniref:D-alanyl-D-alanine carboxypeptidase/D-alanyl-D-alanine-endopeptidase n=1 Tax=Gordonia hydrophobica TaxID=40516 RepID=A0ABZ2U6V0_9ACTN|nr:D-alanyl-D-alanine carboxypeptidase/D-alanyl-D-alanine-endopeptidase [Gordonia hydrophobica]MBM7366111.1 D-alanyl-D-alanine carboxypeptidase/D-alanyl-D-alanine-endopeptidase (penicillin-binding protein 4) [Gordonia hydrophobica]